MIFYLICGLAGLFCILALGLGPLFFGLVGLLIFAWSFRRRRRRWWGLPVAGAGTGFVLAVGLGWSWHGVVGALAGGFVILAAARVAIRLVDGRPLGARWR